MKWRVSHVWRHPPTDGETGMSDGAPAAATHISACHECADSRIYLGVHRRFDATAGRAMGRSIGSYVFENALQPVN